MFYFYFYFITIIIIIIIITFTHFFIIIIIIILSNLLTLKFCKEDMEGMHGHIEIDIWKMGFPWMHGGMDTILRLKGRCRRFGKSPH